MSIRAIWPLSSLAFSYGRNLASRVPVSAHYAARVRQRIGAARNSSPLRMGPLNQTYGGAKPEFRETQAVPTDAQLSGERQGP